jgi:hypothetical protein
MYSDRDKKAAMARLDADLAADDITSTEYQREEQRIIAGSSRSKYLQGDGLLVRAFAGDPAAITKLGTRVVIALIVLALLFVVLGFVGELLTGGMEYDD